VNAAWSKADFNANGVVDGEDFGIWNANKTSKTDRFGLPTGSVVPVQDQWSSVPQRSNHSRLVRPRAIDAALRSMNEDTGYTGYMDPLGQAGATPIVS
jgi:hypothetical protein